MILNSLSSDSDSELVRQQKLIAVCDVCRHCRKVLPLAEAAYSEGLPPFYTLAYHTTKVLVVTFIRVVIQSAC